MINQETRNKINRILERADYGWRNACNDDKDKDNYERNLKSAVDHLVEAVKYAEVMGVKDSQEYKSAKEMFDIVTNSLVQPLASSSRTSFPFSKS